MKGIDTEKIKVLAQPYTYFDITPELKIDQVTSNSPQF